MATVTGRTAESIDELLNENIVNVRVDENGQLIATRRDGSEVIGGLLTQLNSPAFSGNPTAPTPPSTDNDTSIATTKFVKDQGYAPLLSPVFTGNPTVPTPVASDSDTSIANTKFVQDLVAAAKSLYKREGTTAERNLVFPLPTTDANRKILADKQVVWFNTEKGWAETYYDLDTVTAAGVPGLIAGVAPGWYPTGSGPWAAVTGTTVGSSNGYVYDKLIDFGVTETGITSIRHGGAEFFTRAATHLSVNRAGYYDFAIDAHFPNGSGAYICSLIVKRSDGVVMHVIQKAIPLQASFGQLINFAIPRTFAPAGATVSFKVDQGSGNIRVFNLRADYLSPALPFDN